MNEREERRNEGKEIKLKQGKVKKRLEWNRKIGIKRETVFMHWHQSGLRGEVRDEASVQNIER